MTKLVWNQNVNRRYETGLDRGVLYPSQGNSVSWNGLISVEETVVGAERESYYFDGVKFLDFVATKNFKATISAFSSPPEFGPCLGEVAVKPGFFLTRQPKIRFGLSYRTKIDDSYGYKIHLVYNASAIPTGRSYKTMTNSTELTALSWDIESVPVSGLRCKPTSHFIVDSTKAKSTSLATLESQLYGTATAAPYLPTPDSLVTLFNS